MAGKYDELARELAKTALAQAGYPGEHFSQTVDSLARPIAAAIRAAVEQERAECAALHEQVNPASDDERENGDPGAGAMGAVIEYRDLIRARGDG